VSRRALIVLAVLLASTTTPAWAGPIVNVRARTRIEVDSLGKSGVRGHLYEAGSNAPLAGLSVAVSVDGRELVTSTNPNGGFRAVIALDPGPHTVSARFLGDAEYEASEVQDFRADVGKETPAITLTLPSELEAGRPLEGAVEVTVGRDHLPLAVTLTLSVGPATGQLLQVGTVSTDDAGRAALSIPAERLGGAGERRVRLSFAGEDAINPAAADLPVRVMSTTSLADFRSPPGAVAYEDNLSVSGRLVDEAGAGVSGQTITISAGGERVGGTRTGADGRFEARLKASRFAPGSVTLAAEYVSTTPWRRGARTPPVTVTIAEPRPVPVAYTIGAFALTFAVVLGFVLARTRPWLPVLAWLRRFKRRGRQGSGPAAAMPGADPDAAPPTGLKPGRPTLMSTLRRPADAVVSGTVRDVLTGAALAGVRLSLTLDGQPELELVTAADGSFETAPLHAGIWKGHARLGGYVTERFGATVPHRGELRDVRIDLMPVREQVFVIYRGVAQKLLPRRELWGVWTPREILEHVRRRRATGALGELTNFVEEAYFSARVPDESVLPMAVQRAAAARAELGQAADH
jgi:hypothetical protein